MSLVRFRPEAPSSADLSSAEDLNASVAHLVERHLAKVEVASSSLVTRSKTGQRSFAPFFLSCIFSGSVFFNQDGAIAKW